ncbi:hypothetical protein HDV02_000798 [Globomyces sp. JEL0801]|nr:hypothetical protein HDV02_000798 [Globomyces sp. JEL0801]
MNSNQLNKRIRQPTRPEEEPLLPVQTAHITSGGLSPAYVGVSHTQRLPKRTTKTSQKLTLFPEGTESVLPEQDPDLPHVIRSKSEKDQWFNNLERKYLPRVTAYCVANSLKMDKLLAHLRQKNHIHRAAPRRFDEVIYTPFTFSPIKDILAQQASIPDLASSTAAERENNHPATVHENDTFYDATGTDFEVNVNGVGKSIPADVSYADFAKLIAPIGEILYFDYGVIVMWGYTPEEEQQILNDLKPFQEDELGILNVLDIR